MNFFSKLFFCLIFSLFFFGCTKSDSKKNDVTTESSQSIQKSEKTHRWYYFTKNTFLEIDDPQNVPLTEKKAWTETVRISSSAQINTNAYFLVNKLGLLSLPSQINEKINLFSDKMYFPLFTADSLVSVDDQPVFKIYRNTFFNQQEWQKNMPFLVQYNGETNTFYPLLTISDIDLSERTEAVDIFFDGSIWTGAFKYTANERILFDYLQFSSYNPLVSLKNITKTGKIEKKYISIDAYKNIVSPKNFSLAPEPLLKLLSNVTPTTPFMLSYKESNFFSPILYENSLSTVDDYLQGKCFYGKTFIITVFADGTSYFMGSLPSSTSKIISTIKVFKLPKLPDNFIYGEIIFLGKMLYVAWEESFFYETARSGFIAINLETLLFD